MSVSDVSKKLSLSSALAFSCAMLLPTTSLAGEITLRSADGTVNIVGEFVDFDDNSYVVKTALGDLRVSASRVSCIGESCPTFGTVDADVKIVGSDTIGVGVMPLLLSGYAASKGAQATITSTGDGDGALAEIVADQGFGDVMGEYLVSSTSSSDAFSALLDQTAAVGMATRRILPDEARALRADGAGNMIDPTQEHILALDTLVVIVNPNNPVSQLTMDQLRGIYNGQITNWSEVGGDNAPITLVTRDEASDTREVFKSVVYGDAETPGTGSAVVAQDSNEMALIVNSDVNAIGYSGFAFQRGAQPVTLVNECGLPMTPDSFSARTEEYALQRFLYLYNRADTNDEPVSDFVEYALSEPAEEVISKAGFISLAVDRQSQPLDGDRARQLLDPNADPFEAVLMREMLSQMVDYDRLSTTFRFQTGSQNLGQRGLLNLARLADYLERQPAGTNVMLVGFTDDVGAFENNQQLSVSRAEQVRATLQDFAGNRLSNISMGVAGFGEVAPAACNITESGRQINRRVEVWIQTTNG